MIIKPFERVNYDQYWNTAKCENVTYPNPDKPDEPGTLEPKDDVAQTPVQTPEIGTTLTGSKKAKEVDPCKETTLTDVVEYKALDPSKWYMIEGRGSVNTVAKNTGRTSIIRNIVANSAAREILPPRIS